MSCSEMQEGCKQCEMLLDMNKKLAHENGTLKRGREIQRDVMGECAMALDNIKIYPRLNLEIDIDSIKIIQDVIKKLNGEK